MRFRSVLEGVLGGPEKVRLLNLFLAYPGKSFSGREAAKMANLSAPGAWRILKGFEREGLVQRIRVGRTDVWQLNRKHFIVGKLESLRTTDSEAMAALRSTLVEHLKGLSYSRIVLFGSAARGTERPDSDLDILVVVGRKNDKKSAEERLLDASLKGLETFGNRIAPIVFTKNEFEKKKGTELVRAITKEGLVLYPKGG